MRKYVPYILSFFIIAATPVTAQIDTVLQKLKKRYEKAYAWGNGYVLEANSVYAFANKQGKLVRPFTMNSFDTVLSDRAIVYNQWRCGGFYIINADGQDVSGCSNNTYRLISKEKRVFGIIMSNNREVLANDSGRQITFNDHDPNLPGNAFLRTQYFDGRKHWHGIVTKQLDTFLSTTYSSVSFGKDIYAGVRNDSAYVYLRGKGLLFTLPDVGDCIILQNDLIVVKKYGMCALLSRTGQLLTAFRYQKIEDFRYPHSIMPHDDRGHYENPPVIMKYAIVKRGQPQGLIDANGREILPPVYDEISMNTNGWLKVRKAMHDKEFLLDNHFKPVLEADAYDITFVDSRFVTITRSNRYSDDVEIRHYDMQLRKFVKKVPLQKQARQKPTPAIPKTGTECRSNNRDTFCINRAGSVLVRVDGKWGVRSITGDTILPFLYDTAGKADFYYVGAHKKLAVLDEEGNLATPLSLPEPPWQMRDSLLLMRDKSVYSYKGGAVRKIDIYSEPADIGLQFDKGGMAFADQYLGWIKPGIYNRKLQRLAEKPMESRADIKRTGILAITDSTGKMVAVIDSTGRQLIPWMLKPRVFRIYDDAALAINDTGEVDVLYRIDKGSVTIDTILIDTGYKTYLSDRIAGANPHYDYGQYILFVKPGYGKAVLFTNNSSVLLERDIEKIWKYGYYLYFKKNGKVGLRYSTGEIILPPLYDSIASGGSYHDNIVTLYNDGKVGVYDIIEKKLYPPVYDSVCYPASLRDGFLLAYKEGKGMFINKKGKVISAGWTIEPKWYAGIGGMGAVKNGVRYRLYASLGDTIEIQPDEYLPEGFDAIENYMDGNVIVRKDGKTGVYDVAVKQWVIPAIYSGMEREDDYFITHSALNDSGWTAIYTVSGQRLFEVKGYYYPQRLYSFNQWAMNGPYGPPVVNDAGKIIVADTFKNVFAFDSPYLPFYQAITKADKRALIDTSGRVIIPAELTYVEDDTWMYDGYFRVWKGPYARLINPAGIILTGYEYMDIFPAAALPLETSNMNRLGIQYVLEKEDEKPLFIVSKTETDSFGVIDSMGHVLIPCIYDSVKQVYKGRIVVAKKNGKWGIITLKNKPVTGFKYDDIGVFYHGMATYRKEDIEGKLSDEGKEEPKK